MARIINPFLSFLNPYRSESLAGAELYVGNAGTDPRQSGNQQTVQIQLQNGSLQPITQPVILGENGVALYNNEPAQFVVESGRYSIAVVRNNEQLYYASEIITTQTNAIDVWSASVNYTAGESYVVGSNGVGYFAIQNSGPSSTVVDPTTDATRAHWNPYANLKDTIVSSGSMDTLVEAGTYRVQGTGVANKPPVGNNDFFVDVLFINSTSIIQNAWYISSNTSGFFTRSLTGSTWSMWRPWTALNLPNDAAFPSGAAVSLATSLLTFTPLTSRTNTDGSLRIGPLLINFGTHTFTASQAVTFHSEFLDINYTAACTPVAASTASDIAAASYTSPATTGLTLSHSMSTSIPVNYIALGRPK